MVKRGGHSPWGTIDQVDKVAEGIAFVSTPSHGGFFVSPEREKDIPVAHRAYAARWAAPGWYEEDCAAAYVVLAFPELFSEKQVELARSMAAWIEERGKE